MNTYTFNLTHYSHGMGWWKDSHIGARIMLCHEGLMPFLPDGLCNPIRITIFDEEPELRNVCYQAKLLCSKLNCWSIRILGVTRELVATFGMHEVLREITKHKYESNIWFTIEYI